MVRCAAAVLDDADPLLGIVDLEFGDARLLDEINQFLQFTQIHGFFPCDCSCLRSGLSQLAGSVLENR
jgi:hypothetical protein